MTKCANCDSPAQYRISDPGAIPLDLCGTDIPAHLVERRVNGDFDIKQILDEKPPEPVAEAASEVRKPSRK